MPLVTPPSFRSPEPLSARVLYRPRGSRTQAPTHVFGTTGYAFIRQAWTILRRVDFQHSSLGGRKAYKEDRQSAWYDPRSLTMGTTFEVAETTPGVSGTRGTRWDNDFNRALWAWTFLQWDAFNAANRLPSAMNQFFGGASSPQRDGWVSLLNDIENCEVTQSVSNGALITAATLVLHSLDLIASTTEPHVYLEPRTTPLLYGVDPPEPPDYARVGDRRYATWPRSAPPTRPDAPPTQPGAAQPGAVNYVTQRAQPRQPDPVAPTPSTGGGNAGRGPVEVGMSELKKSIFAGVYALGGLLLISGIVVAIRDGGE